MVGENAGPPEMMRGYYRQMVLIREFELRASEMYTRAKIGGYCHLNVGEEATVVGLMDALEPRDYLFNTYRDHGYALARGLEPGRIMAELFGKTAGVSGGWGGSMHLFDVPTRLMGGYGIVGGQIPPATGAALALTYRGESGPDAEAVMCVMGDGATNIGAFHESLNLAAVWRLPIVYVIVNNGLGMATTVEAAAGEPELYKRGCSYRIPGQRVDGNDVLAVRDAARAALQGARIDRQPYLLETMCERLRGHSVVDPARYRSQGETDRVRALGPVATLPVRLLEEGVLAEADVVRIGAQVEEEVTAAVEFADASPSPEPDQLFAHTYATAVLNAPHHLPGERVVTIP
ncbi:thiamine pyrophosphate-dependent enzyme [Rhodococcus opacus]|uniref:thiamine pyrophosphate-dependent enzyme n=1 Tax=Rhodococcus opacus TaxID=37919 RepID=UPI0002A3AAE0|nr:thiamine pyrophosphate-dependent enzyme [Rhodococcus opacus]ELB89744.1 pyruvate dehydrogenase [Rhodococcus wratislaviensis IFP 2016]MDX5962760.1 thiamine pyrophosphate-dependent enzyme [Rhodococcus opacus]CAG7638180.1 Acetoin:2,6-dichlorophenolindophenol oxidoreductase subunit alpha [Rhodococcus opacus]